ncbi:hypothetical protein BGX23_004632 [Mortierella sp. AD031]|nr:hypothetical protein BGX23_004632 [Mortierella sp. AD031]
MVPIGTGDVHLSTGPDPKVLRASSSRKRKSHPPEESSLALRGLESKRARLIREGVSEQAIAFISNNSIAVKTSQRYEPAQQEFKATGRIMADEWEPHTGDIFPDSETLIDFVKDWGWSRNIDIKIRSSNMTNPKSLCLFCVQQRGFSHRPEEL